MARDGSGVRERILDAAVELLREHGVKALTQPQVARAAGVLQGHLTYYFPRRTDLMLAVAQHGVEGIGRDMQAFVASSPPASTDEALRDRIQAVVRALTKDRARTRMMLGLLIEADDDPALAQVMIANAGFIRGLVALAMRRPADAPDIDLGLATLWGIGLLHFLLGPSRGEGPTDAAVARLPSWFARIPPAEEPPPAKRAAAKGAAAKRAVAKGVAAPRGKPAKKTARR